ncbi:MAG: hypothetical protein U5K99_01545 [Anaerolineales bacterium]|nr:hypothetical protein [Anaerolineales bacterium]
MPNQLLVHSPALQPGSSRESSAVVDDNNLPLSQRQESPDV